MRELSPTHGCSAEEKPSTPRSSHFSAVFCVQRGGKAFDAEVFPLLRGFLREVSENRGKLVERDFVRGIRRRDDDVGDLVGEGDGFPRAVADFGNVFAVSGQHQRGEIRFARAQRRFPGDAAAQFRLGLFARDFFEAGGERFFRRSRQEIASGVAERFGGNGGRSREKQRGEGSELTKRKRCGREIHSASFSTEISPCQLRICARVSRRDRRRWSGLRGAFCGTSSGKCRGIRRRRSDCLSRG